MGQEIVHVGNPRVGADLLHGMLSPLFYLAFDFVVSVEFSTVKIQVRVAIWALVLVEETEDVTLKPCYDSGQNARLIMTYRARE